MGSPMSTATKIATRRIFRPSTGVATETSPVLSATSVNTCPPKNRRPASGGCHHRDGDGIRPPRSRSGAATSTEV
jgi:hypothetical protein